MVFGNGKLCEVKLLFLVNVESLVIVLMVVICFFYFYKLNFRYLSNVFKIFDKGEFIM